MASTPGRRRGAPSQTPRPSRSYTYQPPEAPLTLEDQRQFASLLSTSHLRDLRKHLEHAMEKLTSCGGEVNERLADARGRYEKDKELRRRRGEEEIPDEDSAEYQRLGEEETKVEALTARLEEKTRFIIDSSARLQGLTDAVTDVEKEEGQNIEAAMGARQTRSQRRRQRANVDDEDENENEDPQDDDYEDTQEREARERNAQNPPSSRILAKVAEENDKWNGLSLTERYGSCLVSACNSLLTITRYAGDNNYIGFYKMVHDSKFPSDDVPPLPHSSTWFKHLEDPNESTTGTSTRSRNQGRAPPDDDDEIAIQRERVSLKCPLTLMSFVDPVTSTKCPHSFEREAITNMINSSRTTIAPPGGARRGQSRVRFVKCPVCSTPLTAADLRPDPVLLRKVRRAEELEKREAEDDHLEDNRKTKDRNEGIELDSDDGSDDAMDVDAQPATQRIIKAEPLSQAPPRQEGGDEDELEEEEEEEEGDGDVTMADAEAESDNEEEKQEGEGEVEGLEEEGEQEGEEEDEGLDEGAEYQVGFDEEEEGQGEEEEEEEAGLVEEAEYQDGLDEEADYQEGLDEEEEGQEQEEEEEEEGFDEEAEYQDEEETGIDATEDDRQTETQAIEESTDSIDKEAGQVDEEQPEEADESDDESEGQLDEDSTESSRPEPSAANENDQVEGQEGSNDSDGSEETESVVPKSEDSESESD